MKRKRTPKKSGEVTGRLVDSKSLKLGWGIGLVSAIIFGVVTHWELFEYDVFWLVRAGEEILAGQGVQKVDTWSHTAFKEPWYNFQWLSSVVMALVAGQDFTGVITLRSILVGLWFALMTGFLLTVAKRVEGEWPKSQGVQFSLMASLSILLPWMYLMNWLRFQMRPDLFGIIFFVALLWVLVSKIRRQDYWALGVLLVWSNFHSGTVPLGIFTFVTSLAVSMKKEKQRFLVLSGAAILTWFLTPQGWNVLDVVTKVLSVSNNPDLQPFGWGSLKYSEGGWSYSLLFGFVLLSGWSFLSSSKLRWPGPYQSVFWTLGLGVVFLYLFSQKIRSIPYLTLFLVPIAFLGVHRIFVAAWARSRAAFATVLGVGGVFFWGMALPDQVKNLSVPIGHRLSEDWLPIQTVEFIKHTRPQGKLWNFYNHGGYLIGRLREYPVSIDGREIIYLDKERETKQAARFPETYSKHLKEKGVNLVVEALSEGDLAKIHGRFYPLEEWARVFSDRVSTVYVRRIPEHRGIIEQYER